MDETDSRDSELLDSDLIEAVRARAAHHDTANTFPDDDLRELSAAGYLRALVPSEYGGGGAKLADLTLAQQRLAGAAPATALAVNMHQVWVAVARRLWQQGDTSLEWLLREAAAGEVFAFGISEAGNDLVLFGSTTAATPTGDGGYAFTGTKIFTSLAPAWTRLGTFGLDATGGDPGLVYAFLTRDTAGIETLDDWDALGMRGSQSRTTVLTDAVAPADRVARRVPPGPTDDAFVFGIFAAFELLLASVYQGIGRRALDVAVEAVRTRRSLKTGAPYAHDPDIRHRLAGAAIALDGVDLEIRTLAGDLDAGVDHGPRWMPRLSALKSRATENAHRVVEQCLRSAGGSAYFSRHELSRLYRDVLAGLFHPSDDESVHAAWAGLLLGPVPPAGTSVDDASLGSGSGQAGSRP